MRKNYVLDSSVLVFDPLCIYNFKDNNVIIPSYEIRWLERLKEDKKPMVRYQATIALNTIHKLVKNNEDKCSSGIDIKDEKITLYILDCDNENLRDELRAEEIFSVMKRVKEKFSGNLKTILVSRVFSLRLRAMNMHYHAEDYMEGKRLTDNMFTGVREKTLDDSEFSDAYSHIFDRDSNNMVKCPASLKLFPNEFVLVKDLSGKTQNILRYDSGNNSLKAISKNQRAAYGISALNDKQRMAFNLLFDPDVKLVSLIGRPGTGKTLISVASALEQTIPQNQKKGIYDRIIFVRPMVAAGEEMGFLPGDQIDKIRPWMGSFYDSIEALMLFGSLKKKENSESKEISQVEEFISSNMQTGKINLMSTTYMRGRTFHNSFIIVDEAQGITPHIMKMILTRIGHNSKVVIAGDPSDNQIDKDILDSYFNGIVCTNENMKESLYSGSVTFDVEDTERSDFVADVEKMM